MEYETKYTNEDNPGRNQQEQNNFQNKTNEEYLKSLKKMRIPLLITYIITLIIYIYMAKPIINPIYREGFVFIAINIVILLAFIFEDKLVKGKIGDIFKGIIAIMIIVFIGISVITAPIFRSASYYDLIGNIEQYDYDDKKDDLDTTLIPVVDYELAKKLGDKVMGEEIGLGSQFNIGEYYLISTPEDLAWVAPLEPQDFFKWLQNKEGAPGYIYVSATNSNDVRLVQDINGEEIKLKYTDQSYFSNDITRYAYFNNNITKGLTDYSFEIDDEGNPYWIITKYKPTIGFSGADVSGIVVVNAQTGELTNYDIGDKDIPTWIDRIYPKRMIEEQLRYYGKYKNGWLNTITTQKEVIQPTEGISYMFIGDKPYFYTGMTSIQSDESTVGFIITSIVDKETAFFKVNGATESAAKKSAQGKVQQFKYTASNPILLNIYNKPTYFMTLKDSDGLVKQYSFVSVENYNIVGIGSNLENAKKDYYNQLKDNNTLDKDDIEDVELKGTIDRINYLEEIYYFKLNDNKNIFKVDESTSEKLVLTQPGDNVTIKYIEDDKSNFTVTEFENNSF